MVVVARRLGPKFGWELALFHKLRDFSDGLTFLNLRFDWDRYLADHSPRFVFHLVVLNFTLCEFSVYYLHHRVDCDRPHADEAGS